MRIPGLQQARRLLLRGIPITADEAQRLGLVDELSPRGELAAAAGGLAEALARRGGTAMNLAKRHLNQVGQYSFEESMEREILSQALLWKTGEVRRRTEAMLAALAGKKGGAGE